MHPDLSASLPPDWPLAHATFILAGDDVSPEFWTNYFGVTPDRVMTKGETFLYPSGKRSERVAGRGFWAVKSEVKVRSDQLEPHLRFLMSHLGLPRGDLHDLVRGDGINMSVWCYWFNESGDRIPDIPDDIRELMESMGGTIEIDEYR
ncbi:hypothetical protein AWB65_03442 [Caballeronia humi]|uniref:DUF4279 domain-containing protein n=2 Tax=Caballeronia humi TaxID=326474 RepID=A0A158HKK8_9BURK|nr:hypothetical protein AWB65_03442 [Caballeronia humi]